MRVKLGGNGKGKVRQTLSSSSRIFSVYLSLINEECDRRSRDPATVNNKRVEELKSCERSSNLVTTSWIALLERWREPSLYGKYETKLYRVHPNAFRWKNKEKGVWATPHSRDISCKHVGSLSFGLEKWDCSFW